MSTARPTVGEAIAKADAAHAKIGAHEDLCAERYDRIHATMERIEGAVKAIGESQAGSAPKKETDRLWGVLWTIAGFLIIMLLGVIGFLLTHPGWPEPRQAQAVQVQTTVK